MINCIVAVDRNQGIGFNGQMPWPRLTHDLRWFKEKTTNNVVIMGRKTWESIGSKPLPNRINFVLSSRYIKGCDESFNDPDILIELSKLSHPDKEIFIIGGSAVYEEYMDIIDRFYITEIDSSFNCDKFFDLSYVQTNAKQVNEISKFNDPFVYTIKEYLL